MAVRKARACRSCRRCRRGCSARSAPATPDRRGLGWAGRVRALARARAGHRTHRGGAAGGQRSGHRCSDEHRVPANAGSAEREGGGIMRRLGLLFLVLAAGVFVFAGCGGGDDDGGGGDDSVDLTQEKDVTIAMVTHGDGGLVLVRGQEGRRGGGEGPRRHAQVLGVQQRPRGAGAADRGGGDRGRRRHRRLGARTRTPSATRSKTAIDAGIPVITLNSGAEESASLGAITHVGQTETIAGEGAGAKLKEAGATKLICIIHEQGNIGLNQRCDGASEGLRRRRRERPGRRHERHLDDADRDPVQARVRRLDRRRAGAEPGHRGRRA